jgi:hypothetical protein
MHTIKFYAQNPGSVRQSSRRSRLGDIKKLEGRFLALSENQLAAVRVPELTRRRGAMSKRFRPPNSSSPSAISFVTHGVCRATS